MPKLKSFQQKKFARIQGVAHLNPMDLIDSSNSDEDDDFNKKLKGKYNIQKIPGAHVPTAAPPETVATEEACNNNSNEINEETPKDAVCSREIKKEPISQESEGWGDLENLALEPVQTLETPDFLKNEDSSPEQFGERKRRPMSSTPIPLDDEIRIVSKDLEEERAILIESSSEASQQSDAEDWQFKTHVTTFQPLPVQQDSSSEKISLIEAIAALEKKWNGEESCNKAEISLESEKSAFEMASSTESARKSDQSPQSSENLSAKESTTSDEMWIEKPSESSSYDLVDILDLKNLEISPRTSPTESNKSFGPHLPPNFAPNNSLSIEEESAPVSDQPRNSSLNSSDLSLKTQESPHDLLNQTGTSTSNSGSFMDEPADRKPEKSVPKSCLNYCEYEKEESLRPESVENIEEKETPQWSDSEDEKKRQEIFAKAVSSVDKFHGDSMTGILESLKDKKSNQFVEEEKVEPSGEMSWSDSEEEVRREVRSDSEHCEEMHGMDELPRVEEIKEEKIKQAEDCGIFTARTKMMIRAHLISTKGATAWQLRGFLESQMGMRCGTVGQFEKDLQRFPDLVKIKGLNANGENIWVAEATESTNHMAKLIGKAKCDQSKKKKLLNKVVKPPPKFSPVISKPKSNAFETGFRKDFRDFPQKNFIKTKSCFKNFKTQDSRIQNGETNQFSDDERTVTIEGPYHLPFKKASKNNNWSRKPVREDSEDSDGSAWSAEKRPPKKAFGFGYNSQSYQEKYDRARSAFGNSNGKWPPRKPWKDAQVSRSKFPEDEERIREIPAKGDKQNELSMRQQVVPTKLEEARKLANSETDPIKELIFNACFAKKGTIDFEELRCIFNEKFCQTVYGFEQVTGYKFFQILGMYSNDFAVDGNHVIALCSNGTPFKNTISDGCGKCSQTLEAFREDIKEMNKSIANFSADITMKLAQQQLVPQQPGMYAVSTALTRSPTPRGYIFHPVSSSRANHPHVGPQG